MFHILYLYLLFRLVPESISFNSCGLKSSFCCAGTIYLLKYHVDHFSRDRKMVKPSEMVIVVNRIKFFFFLSGFKEH